MWAEDRRRKKEVEEALFAGRAPPPAMPVGKVFAPFMHGQSILSGEERVLEWMRDVK